MDMHATTQDLATFHDHAVALVEQVRQSGQALTLTVDGKAVVVVQDVASHRRLLDLAAQASAEAGIRRGLADIEAGRVQPAREAFDLLRAEFGIPR